MKKVLTTILGIVIVGFIGFILLGNEGSIEPLDGCESNEELNVYCNFMNPEDLALTPDGKFLIVSEFGGMAPLVEIPGGGWVAAVVGRGVQCLARAAGDESG